MDPVKLFRREVLEKKFQTQYGVVYLNLPIKYSLIIACLTIFIILFLLFITKAKISEKYTVKGYVNSEKGVSNIYPLKPGFIIKQNVKLGDKVAKGDILFVVDTSTNSAKKSSDEEIIDNLFARKKAIQDEMRIEKKKLISLKGLLKKNYVSVHDYNKVYTNLLELKNKKQLIELEIIRYKNNRAYSVRANTPGIVTNVLQIEGHFIKPDNVIIQIIPLESRFVAELYVPVEKSGFLNPGTSISINYDAYPYTRFGSYKGIIKQISETILTDQDEIKPLTVGSPYYRVMASLEKSTINVDGNQRKIQQGMTFTASFYGRKRTILQWILDPIGFYYDKIF